MQQAGEGGSWREEGRAGLADQGQPRGEWQGGHRRAASGLRRLMAREEASFPGIPALGVDYTSPS